VTDDLVKRLIGPQSAEVDYATRKEAAARIEQLEAERDTLFRKVALAQEWRDRDRQRAIDAEAKLALAIEALNAFKAYENSAFFGPDAEKHKRAAYRGMKRKLLAALTKIEEKT